MNSSQVKSEHYKFKIIGHSLGGTMAELCAARLGVECITFESPGSLNIMQQFSNLYPKKNYDLIRSYLSAPNPINTLNTHPGHIYRMHLPHTNCFNAQYVAECLLNIVWAGSLYYLTFHSVYIGLIRNLAIKEIARQNALRSFFISAGIKLGTNFVNWRDDIKWLESQHSIANIAQFLAGSRAISKMHSWPTKFEEPKESKVMMFSRDVVPLRKDRPGLRSLFNEDGMKEAQIEGLPDYKMENNQEQPKGFRGFLKYKML